MVIAQGEVWWADLGEPSGSEPGFRRPVLVVQGDALNRTALATVVVVPLTSQLKWAGAAGNLQLAPRETGLSKPSFANASQIVALDRTVLKRRVGKIPRLRLLAVLAGIDIVLGKDPG
ncbi:MAG: type II toxin-antitoxin system PemK/MazF family toxin [Polyangiaceae bacterium]|nr:type II toxin-antitoxin system PemK/MazF family toxin [Polyangiaceae bacterium]